MPSKEVQRAKAQLTLVQRKLEQKYGHMHHIRHTTLRVLEVLDLGVVRTEVFQSVSEDFILKAPNYWLSHAHMTLIAWMMDRRELAEQSLHEALKLDTLTLHTAEAVGFLGR